MTSTFFDAGDLQRLDRERQLTEQAPRVLPEEDRSPIEEPIQDELELDDGFDLMLEGLLMVLQRRAE